MPKKRRLTDLYIIGTDVTLDDGQGEPVTIFARKLTPIDHETALRRANAARSRNFAVKNEPDSEEYLALTSMTRDYSREDLTAYLIEDLRGSRAVVIQERRADDDEWKKDGYLQGLNDAWNDGLEVELLKEPKHVEGKRVKKELDRFNALVAADLEAEINDFTDVLEDRDVEALRELVLDKLIEVRASIAWLNEYRRCEVWLSVREADRKTRYFTSREEVDDLSDEVFNVLQDAYRDISVEPTEGKDSAATPPSSPSSEQQGELETDEPSVQSDAAA